MRKSFILASFLSILLIPAAFAGEIGIFSTSDSALTKSEQGGAESLINPFIDITRQQGASRLAGRYAHAKAIPSRAGGGTIIAPTSLIMTIGQDGAGTMDAAGETTPIRVTLNTQASTPTLTTAYADDPSEEPMTDYAVLVPQGSRFLWRLVSTSSGNVRHMIPLTGEWFPAGYLEGSWQGDDGSQIAFQNGEIIVNGQALGSYTASDNRLSVTLSNGQRDLLFTAYDPDEGLLILTFNGSDPQNWNAMTYRRAQPAPQTPQYPQTPQQPQYPQTPQQPQYPQQPQQPQYPQGTQPFPQFPGAPQQPQISLDGVWGTVLPNGVQLVMQIQGSQYWMWANGQPSESGMFQIQGNMLMGRTSTGAPFQNQFQCDGRTLIMKDPRGFSITYQRMQ